MSANPSDESPPRVGEDVRARLDDVLALVAVKGGYHAEFEKAVAALIAAAAFPRLAAGPATEDEGPIYSEIDTANVAQLLGLLEIAKKYPTVVQHLRRPSTPLAQRLWDVMDPKLFGLPVAAGPAEPVAWQVIDAEGEVWRSGTGQSEAYSKEGAEQIVHNATIKAPRLAPFTVIPLYRAAPSRPVPWRSAWVIEDSRQPPSDGPLYWCGFHWHKDHLQAVRFLRMEDAHRAVMGLPNGWHLIGKPVEHAWATDAVWQSAVAAGGTDG